MAARVSLLLLAIFLLRDFPFVSRAGGFETRPYKCQPISDARMNGWLVTETYQKWLNRPIKIMNGIGTPRSKSKIERIEVLLNPSHSVKHSKIRSHARP